MIAIRKILNKLKPLKYIIRSQKNSGKRDEDEYSVILDHYSDWLASSANARAISNIGSLND